MLRHIWPFLAAGKIPSLAVKVSRLAAGNYTGRLESTSPVTMFVEQTGQETAVPAGGSFTASFPSAGTYTLRFYATAQDAVTYINLDGAGVVCTEGDPDGVFDTSKFLNLTYANVGSSYVHTVRGYYSDAIYVRNTLLTSGTLNLTDVQAARLYYEFGKFTSLALPTDRTRLTTIEGGSNRLSGSITLGPMPVLKILSLTSDSNTTGRLTAVNVVGCPALETIALGSNRTQVVAAGATDMAKVKVFTARFGAFGGANFAAFRQDIEWAVALIDMDFRECGLSGADIESLLDTLIATTAQRPAASVAKTLKLEGFTAGQLNEASVQTQERTKIATLTSTLNLVTSFNRPRLNLTRLNTNTIRCTYTGSRDITIWAIGDTIRLSASTNTTSLPNGDYVVTAGSGKIWDIAQTGATIGMGATGTFDKI